MVFQNQVTFDELAKNLTLFDGCCDNFQIKLHAKISKLMVIDSQIKTDRQTDRQTDRPTDERQADTYQYVTESMLDNIFCGKNKNRNNLHNWLL